MARRHRGKRSRDAENRRRTRQIIRENSRYDPLEKELINMENYYVKLEVTNPILIFKGAEWQNINLVQGEILRNTHNDGTIQIIGGE